MPYNLLNKILLILRFINTNLLVCFVFLPWVASAQAQTAASAELGHYAKELVEVTPDTIQQRLRDAHNGDVAAMFEIANYLRLQPENDTDPRYQLAFGWALNAARRGHPQAAQMTGAMYRRGVGVAQDFSRSRKWLERALARGASEPNFELALLYSDETNISFDDAKAAQYLAAAIRANEPRACLISARNQMTDGASFRNVIEEVMCAADGGLVEAMEMLGNFHLTQRSPYAERRARLWLQRAMLAGSQSASETLANLSAD